jgi:hypothetical protein
LPAISCYHALFCEAALHHEKIRITNVRKFLVFWTLRMPMLAIDACFKALARHAELVVPVLALLDRGAMVGPMRLKAIASAAGISSAKLPPLRDALQAGASEGVFKESSLGGWTAICSIEDATKLRLMLHGINVYLSQVYKKDDDVIVVVSKPALPSRGCKLLPMP